MRFDEGPLVLPPAPMSSQPVNQVLPPGPPSGCAAPLPVGPVVDSVADPSSRVQRVNAALLENSHSHNSPARMHDNSSARSLHGLHVARSVQNSLNSVGDRGVRGRGVCVPGETKSLCTSTWLGVRCPAVEKLASPQQAPGSLHGEVWASIFHRNRARRFSGKWKSYRGVLSKWLVLHVLITLLCHLGQAE